MVGEKECQKNASVSEAQALTDILAWSEDRPVWQQDALRRLCTKDELDKTDISDLTVLCKTKGKGSVPLTAEHIPDPAAAGSTVNLKGTSINSDISGLPGAK